MDKTRAKRMAGELRGQRVGGWEIGPYLGNGFSAVVMESEKDGQRAALKIIDPEMIERAGFKKQLKRVHREKELAGHLHPNLVQILDAGHCLDTNHLFVAMELLKPLTLTKVCKELPAVQIGPIIAQLAQAARFLEEREIVHRDIKPDNVVVTEDYSQAKLLDLGVLHPPADPDDRSAGTGDTFVGTARYSPPEFLYREEEDTVECWRAITFYQLGATLYDLLMLRPIFHEYRQPLAKLYQAVRDCMPVIDPDDAEPWLVDLARRCLHKDWRVRAEIVKWEDFEGPPTPPESSQEIQERLRSRIGRGRVVALASCEEAPTRPTRRTLNLLAGAVATSVRDVCSQSDVFPPVEILHDVVNQKPTVTLRTGPSPAHELDGELVVRLVIDPLDAQATNVRLTATARLGAPPKAEHESTNDVFVGEFSSSAYRKRIDIYLHAVLEASFGAGTPPEKGLAIHPTIRGT